MEPSGSPPGSSADINSHFPWETQSPKPHAGFPHCPRAEFSFYRPPWPSLLRCAAQQWLHSHEAEHYASQMLLDNTGAHYS